MAPKRFVVAKNIRISEKFEFQKIRYRKKNGSRKFWLQKLLGPNDCLVPKKILSPKFWVMKNFDFKEIFGCQKNLGSKFLGAKKSLG